MLDWNNCDTVLLDMDGTLLDLNFDNHFWLEFVPQKYAEKHQISPDAAKQQLFPQFKAMEGRLEWYCLDYWSQALELDIAGLKNEVASLIAVLPHVVDFLTALRQSRKQVFLVTNAHRDSLDLKMEKTCLQFFFDQIICSHDFGWPKERAGFWQQLEQKHIFDKSRTLLIDDSLPVLHAAKAYGIAYLISVAQPDSRKPPRTIEGYPAITDFQPLISELVQK